MGNTFQLKTEEGRVALEGVSVDFESHTMKLVGQSVRQNQPFKRSLKNVKSVLDTTCGLAKDSFFMLNLGCKVTALERHPLIYELVVDGVSRAKKNAKLSVLFENFHLILGDAREYMQSMKEKGQRIDAVYVDPMYPPKDTSALPKKEMQILRSVLAHESHREEEIKELIQLGLEVSDVSVVLKRPVWAEPPLKPMASFEGKMVRYDVYKKS